jgi:hypothetical protein
MNSLRPALAFWTASDRQAHLQKLKRALAAHESNIALLCAFNAGKRTLTGKGYTRGAENYSASPAAKKRLPQTLANLKQQCGGLRLEIALLKNGGSR